jgi:hypothetical protein
MRLRNSSGSESKASSATLTNSSRFILHPISAHTRCSAATSGCTIGIAFQSIGAGRLGRRLRCQRCSSRCRMCRTICAGDLVSYFKDYNYLKKRWSEPAGAEAWAVIHRMSSGERLWYRVGAYMAQRSVASKGRAILTALVKQGPRQFMTSYESLPPCAVRRRWRVVGVKSVITSIDFSVRFARQPRANFGREPQTQNLADS